MVAMVGAGIMISGQERPSHPISSLGFAIEAGTSTSISSGTYNPVTGLVTLTLGLSLGLNPGDGVVVSGATGTGSFASINGTFTAGAGTTGITLTYTITTGLTMTISGGNVADAPSINSSACNSIEAGVLIGPQLSYPLIPNPQSMQTAGFSSAGHVSALSQHPGAFLRPGVQGPNVRPAIRDSVLTSQEQPYHPLPWLKSSYNFTTSNLFSPETRMVVSGQETPPQPRSVVNSGVQGPNVASVTIGVFVEQDNVDQPRSYVLGSFVSVVVQSRPFLPVLKVQEQPIQPGPIFNASIQGPNVGRPAGDSVATKQEQPGHQGSIIYAGVQGPNVLPPITTRLVTTQQQPDHPASYILRSFNRQDPIPPTTNWIRTTQEQPNHPGPFSRPSQIYVASTTRSSETRQALTVQEQPYHPGSISNSGVQGPDVATVNIAVFLFQEDTIQPRGSVQAPALSAAVPHPPLSGSVFTSQESVSQAPTLGIRSGVQGPNVMPPIGRSVSTQEQPSHPGSFLFAGVHGPNVAVGITSLLTKVEEITGHPQPFLRANIFSAACETRQRTTVQEQPQGHPTGFTQAGVQGAPTIKPPVTDRVLTAQENPFHPGSFSSNFVTPTIVTPTPPVGQILTRQEQPFHPGSISFPGIFINSLIVPIPPGGGGHRKPRKGGRDRIVAWEQLTHSQRAALMAALAEMD